MYIHGKKVYGIEIINKDGGAIITELCKICDNSVSILCKVNYTKDGYWDDIEEISICQHCLIDSGFFYDEQDLMNHLGI